MGDHLGKICEKGVLTVKTGANHQGINKSGKL